MSLWNDSFVSLPVGLLGKSFGSWPLLDLVWFHARRAWEDLMGPAFDSGLSLQETAEGDIANPFADAFGSVLKRVDLSLAEGTRWTSPTRVALPIILPDITQSTGETARGRPLAMGSPRSPGPGLIQQYPLIPPRKLGPDLVIESRHQGISNSLVYPSNSIYLPHNVLAHWRVPVPPVASASGINEFASSTLTNRYHTPPAHKADERRTLFLRLITPSRSAKEPNNYDLAGSEQSPEPMYYRPLLDTQWPLFIHALLVPRLPVVKPLRPVYRTMSLLEAVSVTSEPPVLALTPQVETRQPTRAQLFRHDDNFTAVSVSSEPPVLALTPQIETRQPTWAQLFSHDDNFTMEEGQSASIESHPAKANPMPSRAIHQMSLTRTMGVGIAPVLRIIDDSTKRVLSYLKHDKLIRGDALRSVIEMGAPVQPAEPEKSKTSMPAVGIPAPIPLESPAMPTASEYWGNLGPVPLVPPPAASVRFGAQKKQQKEPSGTSLLFEETLSLGGGGYQVSPLAARTSFSAKIAHEARLSRNESGESAFPSRPANSTPCAPEESYPVGSHASASTEKAGEFGPIHGMAGILSVFRTQSTDESTPPSTPELALAPVENRTEPGEAPSLQVEARIREHETEAPAPDLEAIANDVYRILKRRLGRERERSFGVS